MYLALVSEFSDFLSRKEHSVQDILNHVVRVTLAPLEATSAIYFQANNSNEFFIAGESGISKSAETELLPLYSLSENYPVSDAIQGGEFLWLPPSLESKERYPILENFPQIIGGKTLIVVPVFSYKTPVGAMAIFCDTKEQNSVEIQSFLNAVISIFSLYFSRMNAASLSKPTEFAESSNSISGGESPDLTSRQNVILRLVSEDRTNASIGESLGYSESTIRQEIMRIFAKLGCSTRKQAADIYRSWNRV